MGYVHENVVGALRQIAEFEIKTRDLHTVIKRNNFSGFIGLLHNIDSCKNNFNANVHIVLSHCNREMQSAVSSGIYSIYDMNQYTSVYVHELMRLSLFQSTASLSNSPNVIMS